MFARVRVRVCKHPLLVHSLLRHPDTLRSFEKGLADREDCREEILPMPEPFFLCPLRRRGTHFWITFLAVFGGCLSPTPPANPLSKSLIHMTPRPRNSKDISRASACPHIKNQGKGPFNAFFGLSFEASDFLNRRRNCKDFPQREANFAIFHRKMHRNRNRIVTAEKSQPISQKKSLLTI